MQAGQRHVSTNAPQKRAVQLSTAQTSRLKNRLANIQGFMNGLLADLEGEPWGILRAMLKRDDLLPVLRLCRRVAFSEARWMQDLKKDLKHLRAVLTPLPGTLLRCPGFVAPVRLRVFGKSHQRLENNAAWTTEPASMLLWMSVNGLQNLTPVEAIQTMNRWPVRSKAAAAALSKFLETATPSFDYAVRSMSRQQRPVWVVVELRIRFEYRSITGWLYTREVLSRPR